MNNASCWETTLILPPHTQLTPLYPLYISPPSPHPSPFPQALPTSLPLSLPPPLYNHPSPTPYYPPSMLIHSLPTPLFIPSLIHPPILPASIYTPSLSIPPPLSLSHPPTSAISPLSTKQSTCCYNNPLCQYAMLHLF